MPDQAEMLGWIIVITWLLLVVGLIYAIDWCNKKFRGMVAAYKARRFLIKASPSEVLAARCKVLDARRNTWE